MALNKEKQDREVEQNSKTTSQFRLQAATRLHEVGIAIIADQHAAVNTFPGLVHTARHTTRVVCTRSRWPNLLEGGAEGVEGKRGEVVTR